MRIRDSLLVVVGLLAALFGWYQEGVLHFRAGFFVRLSPSRAFAIHNTPKPIVTDMNGDGDPEMLMIEGNNDMLVLYPTHRIQRNAENLFVGMKAKKKATFSGAVVAMTTGYLDFPFGENHDGTANAAKKLRDETLAKENDLNVLLKKEAGTAKFFNLDKDEGGVLSKGSKRNLYQTGKRTRLLKKQGVYNRKQYIALLTEFYNVRLLDSDLNEIWNTDIIPLYLARITPHSASLSVRPERIFEGDLGSVIVRAPVSSANGTEGYLYVALDGSSGAVRWSRVVNPYSGSLGITDADVRNSDAATPIPTIGEKEKEDYDGFGKRKADAINDAKSRAQRASEPLLTCSPGDDQTPGKCSVGASPGDQQVATTGDGAVFDQGSILMNDEDLDQGSTELPWMYFREAIVAALPHQYAHEWDSRIEPTVFYKSKGRSKTGLDKSGNSKSARRASNKGKVASVLDEDDVGELGQMIGNTAKRHKDVKQHKFGRDSTGQADHHDSNNRKRRNDAPANVILSRHKRGLDVIHYYTGKIVTRVEPLKHKVSVYHDVDDDYRIDEVTNFIGTRQAVYKRVVRSHDRRFPPFIRHGIQEEVLCLGAVYSGVPIAFDPLYNATICDTPGLFSSMSLISHFMRGDGAEEHPTVDSFSLIGSRNVAHEQTSAASPVVIQRHIRKGRDTYVVRRYPVFFIDTGLVTAIDPVTKRVLWRSQTPSDFSPVRSNTEQDTSQGLSSENEKDNRADMFPHMMPYAQYHRPITKLRTMARAIKEAHPFVLAVGQRVISVLSSDNGHVAATVDLPNPPYAPVQVVDFNGDGVNDLVIVSKDAIYGYTGHVHTSGAVIPMLMTLMLALVASLFVAKELSLRGLLGEGSAQEFDSADSILPTTVNGRVAAEGTLSGHAAKKGASIDAFRKRIGKRSTD